MLRDNFENIGEEILTLNTKSSSGLILLITVFMISVIVFVSFCKIDKVVKANGIVRPKENVSIVKNIVEGKVLSIDKINGELVNVGDEIFKIDCNDIILQKTNLENNYRKSVSDLKDNKRILNIVNDIEKVTTSESEMMLAEYNYYISKMNTMTKQSEILMQKYLNEEDIPSTLTTLKSIQEKKNEYELSILQIKEYKKEYLSKLVATIKQLEIEVKNLENSIKNLNFQLEHSSIVAQICGYLIIDNINKGDYINANQEIGKIIPVNEGECKAEIMVSAKDIGQLSNDLKVKCRFPSFPYNEYKGLTATIKIINADSTIDSNGIYYQIICVFDKIFLQDRQDKKYYLKPGIEVDARIIIEKKTILSFFLEKMDFTI